MTGALALIRDFVNTRDIDAGRDALGTPGALEEWLRARGLAPRDLTVRDWKAALSIREGLRHILACHNGAKEDPAQIASLNAALVSQPVRVKASAGGRLGWGKARDAALGDLGAVLSEAVADPEWARLKVCRNDACRWAFFDASRNRSHKWCSMRACGNLMKARAYRSRKKVGG